MISIYDDKTVHNFLIDLKLKFFRYTYIISNYKNCKLIKPPSV